MLLEKDNIRRIWYFAWRKMEHSPILFPSDVGPEGERPLRSTTSNYKPCCQAKVFVVPYRALFSVHFLPFSFIHTACSARDWDGKDYLRLIPRVVW